MSLHTAVGELRIVSDVWLLCVCVCVCVRACVRACALKIVSMDKILRFTDILINLSLQKHTLVVPYIVAGDNM